MDPLAEDYPGYSPYNYVLNNPINLVDPTGMGPTSTIVTDNGNGTYTVVGGDLNDNDKGIYIDDGRGGKGKKIGESVTMYSFYNDDQQDKEDGIKVGWAGTIDINSNEGVNWFNKNIRNSEPSLIEYMAKALTGNSLDFKRLDKDGVPLDAEHEDYNNRDYHHRGMYWNTKEDGTKIYGSARDFGNYAAGYIAGVKNLSWDLAKLGFNGLETLTSGGSEAKQSVLAQKAGWNYGHSIGVQRATERKASMDKLRQTNPEIFYPRGLKW